MKKLGNNPKKLANNPEAQMFDEECSLEIEILGITQMVALQTESGWDRRRFYLGLLAFILYLLAYAVIIFLAELDVPTGMNEYKESIWFALMTVTTLGYG